MAKQFIFKDKYVQELKNKASSGASIALYNSKSFAFEKRQLLTLPNVEVGSNLLSKLDVKDDFKTAVVLYEEFKDLEPIQAADERLWTYLTHVDLYPYMIERWPGVYSGEASKQSKYILDHWFLGSQSQSGLIRHAIAGLWWSVYLSVDESAEENRYDLTKILFRQLDFPTRTLGLYKLGRHKEAVLGILEFIQQNEELFKHNFETKTRFVTKHLNIIGGVKPISYYDRDFFKSELQKVSEVISRIR